MYKVLITTVPFAEVIEVPRQILSQHAEVDFLVNPLNKKLTESELIGLVEDVDIIIAGTEPITKKVINAAKKLKFISRVGIGLDSVDLTACKEKNIIVSYTPDAPAKAVGELTICLMLSLLRNVHVSNSQLHMGSWYRFFGARLEDSTIGIIGTGRIGKRVLSHLRGFSPAKILVNNLENNLNELPNDLNIEFTSKDKIYSESDIISLHLPLTSSTRNLITEIELSSMKKNCSIINTSRGGIINEEDLFYAVKNKLIAGAAIDTFVDEPYNGELKELDNVLLTAHMGSMSVDCRSRMEIEATEEALRFINGDSLQGIVPNEEYILQSKFN